MDLLFRPLHPRDVGLLFEPGERALVNEWLAQQERGELYIAVAEAGGVPVGRMCLNFSWRSDEGAAYGFAFHVLPPWRALGIGTQIDRHCEQVARDRGLHALQCAVARTNPRGLAWHQRLGYRTIDERVVRWQAPDGEHELDSWIVERRWGRHRSFLKRIFLR